MAGGTNLKTWVVMSFFVVGMVSVAAGRTIYVDNVGSADFSNIQAAIDDSNDGDTIIVQPGLYIEFVKFGGKNITLTSTNPSDFNVVASTIISTVGFLGTEEPDCMLTGFKIRGICGAEYQIDPSGRNHTHATISHCLFSHDNTYDGRVISGCDGTISNCVVVDNKPGSHIIGPAAIIGCHGLIKNCTIAHNRFTAGIWVREGYTTTVENCIIYHNAGGIWGEGTVNILYSDVQGIYGGGHVNWGPGNINTDPCFVRIGHMEYDGQNWVFFEGDYHLQSQAGRWDPNNQSWVQDANTSPCIDAGDPRSPIGYEPFPNGGIINMGAYGGTAEASKSYFGTTPCKTVVAGDINGDCKVNFLDFRLMALNWLEDVNTQPPSPPP